MTNTPETPPSWALDLAVERLNTVHTALYYARDSHVTIVLACHIAKYEQPPVDPDAEALMRILSCVLMFVQDDNIFRNALAQYKKEIGK
jgi:hypothetical protein